MSNICLSTVSALLNSSVHKFRRLLTNSAAEVRFLRDITVYRRTDHIRNQTIGQEVNVLLHG
jgi:hypothetical protein